MIQILQCGMKEEKHVGSRLHRHIYTHIGDASVSGPAMHRRTPKGKAIVKFGRYRKGGSSDTSITLSKAGG